MLNTNHSQTTNFKILIAINFICFITIFSLALMNQYAALMAYPKVFYKHLIKTSIGLILFCLIFFISKKSLERAIPVFYVLTMMTLLFVLIAGTTVKGATRWIAIGGFSFQPSEVAKVIVPLMSAYMLYLLKNSSLLLCILAALLVTIIPFGLIAKQPDLGSSLLILYSGLIPLILLKIPTRFFIYTTMILVIIAPGFWGQLHPYQQQRIQTLFSPQTDLKGSGYHIHQSKIAIGSGQVLGKGWTNNTQAYLGYLPESDTDFAFALYAEERGLLMTSMTIALLYLFYVTLMALSLKPTDEFSRLICFSLAAPQFIYCFINIAMVSGIVPVVGVPLPFFSRGGSSFLVQMLTLGLIYRFILKK